MGQHLVFPTAIHQTERRSQDWMFDILKLGQSEGERSVLGFLSSLSCVWVRILSRCSGTWRNLIGSLITSDKPFDFVSFFEAECVLLKFLHRDTVVQHPAAWMHFETWVGGYTNPVQPSVLLRIRQFSVTFSNLHIYIYKDSGNRPQISKPVPSPFTSFDA